MEQQQLPEDHQQRRDLGAEKQPPYDLDQTVEQLRSLKLTEEQQEEYHHPKYDESGWEIEDNDGYYGTNGWSYDDDNVINGFQTEEEQEPNYQYNYNNNYNDNIMYPVRPDAEDCAFYMKTGTCKFGSDCKFNHPLTRTKSNYLGARDKVKEYEDLFRENDHNGQMMECKGEDECSYYMCNDSCKFGANCKFNHPDPTDIGESGAPSGYSNGGSFSPQAAGQLGIPPWSSPSALKETASYIPVAYSPQGVPPQSPKWNGYQASVYPEPARNMHSPPSAYMNLATDTNGYSHHQQQMTVEEFPERPDEAECSYYIKTGDCKFKFYCRYHHPRDLVPLSPPCALNDKGLPLRPDELVCSHYNRYGICKFGPSCKFDHPV